MVVTGSGQKARRGNNVQVYSVPCKIGFVRVAIHSVVGASNSCVGKDGAMSRSPVAVTILFCIPAGLIV